jgi:hypothetical protein
MNDICAWCGKTLGPARHEGPVSHGICESCLVDVEYSRQPFADFLGTLGVPAMAVDGDVRALEVNERFLSFVGKDRASVLGRLGGEVISCIYAGLPGGCGRTVHCDGCTIRSAVTHTHRTGEPQIAVPAFAHVQLPAGPVKIWFRISTERVGGVVLLRVDEAQAGEGHPPAV